MANEVGIIRTYFKKNPVSGKINIHHDFEVVQAPTVVNPNKCSCIEIFPLTSSTLYINGMKYVSNMQSVIGNIYFENSEITTVFKLTI